MKQQSKSLLGIQEEHLKILNRLEEYAAEFDGEIPDEMWDELIISKEELETKVGSYVWRIQELKGEQETLKEQSSIWIKKAEAKERAIERMKWVLAEVSKRLGEKNDKGNYSLKAGDIKINYQHTHPVEIEDEDEIPESYKKYNFTFKDISKTEVDRILKVFGANKDNDRLVKIETKISKTNIKADIETAADKKETKEFTLSETVPGAYIDNKAGFIKIY